MKDPIDREDYKNLFKHILRQAMDDYVKLQHPKYRKKKYLTEAFHNAVGMLFDSSYRFLYVETEEGEEMSLKDLIQAGLGTDQFDVKKLQEHIVKESLRFWNTKTLNTLEIPEVFIVDGHVYTLYPLKEDEEGYAVDYDEKEIRLALDESGSENQEHFILSILEILCYHNEIKLAAKSRMQLGKALFRVLRINNCFTGHH